MAKPKIGIIVGSTRPNRFADKPTEWIEKIVRARGDVEVEVIDLRDYPMPFFNEAMSPRAPAIFAIHSVGLSANRFGLVLPTRMPIFGLAMLQSFR